MKSKIISLAIIASVIIFAGCEKDNYDPPTSFLTGTVVYNGTPVGVRSNATELELWQHGYALKEKIPVYIAQDGTFSARLFDGNYKLVRLGGAPWENQTDSIDVTVSGNTTLDVPVTPYFVITNESFTNSASVITSSCNVTQIGALTINSLTLYIGVTSIVDANNNAQSNIISGAALSDLSTSKTNVVTLNSDLAARDYIFVRLAVKINGVGESYYSPAQKIIL